MSIKNKTLELLGSIPGLTVLTMNPSIFSGDTDKHDCDTCPAYDNNAGDLYDEEVCRDCWKQAILNSDT